MERLWRSAKRSFYKFRHAMILRRRYTPYACGSAGRSAIPCSIMLCESGGSYEAENASGAYGKYQLMPEWWYPGKPRPAEQDRIAHDLWAGGAGASNWVCA